ncbi:MAG: DUF4209 domain-containing protein [Firmicutes bacterium]|nr:DUF4209 domain-containing protein [Bacillota bacterium]
MNMLDDAALEAFVKALAQARDYSSVGERLRQTAPFKEGPFQAIIWAFDYRLVVISDKERRRRWGAYAPQLEWQGGATYPPTLDSVKDEDLALWENVARDLNDPLGLSRLHDLLWERRHGSRPDLHARAAIEAYLELSFGRWGPLDKAHCLVRALELAQRISDTGLRDKALTRCIYLARASLTSERPLPGVVVRLISAVQALSPQSTELDSLSQDAEAAFSGNPWVLESLFDLKASRTTDPKQRRVVGEDLVRLWRDVAERNVGVARFAYLQHALELAHKYGLSDHAHDIKRSIQGLTNEDLQLSCTSATALVPTDEAERFIAWFIEPSQWENSLLRFGYYGPPGGGHQNRLARVTQLMADHPLQFLFPKAIIGAENALIRLASSPEEHKDVALIEDQALGIRIWGVFAADVLDRIRAKYGEPTVGELTGFFKTEIISEDIAERVARALLLFWNGETDESAHILVPRLEAIIRTLAREIGLPVIREPRGDCPGGVKQLGDLLHSLSGYLDDDWRRYLDNLLVEPVGVNLRNRVAHGLISSVNKQEAALLIHCVCFLRRLELRHSG